MTLKIRRLKSDIHYSTVNALGVYVDSSKNPFDDPKVSRWQPNETMQTLIVQTRSRPSLSCSGDSAKAEQPALFLQPSWPMLLRWLQLVTLVTGEHKSFLLTPIVWLTTARQRAICSFGGAVLVRYSSELFQLVSLRASPASLAQD